MRRTTCQVAFQVSGNFSSVVWLSTPEANAHDGKRANLSGLLATFRPSGITPLGAAHPASGELASLETREQGGSHERIP